MRCGYLRREICRTLRRRQTRAEARAWQILRNRGVLGWKFRRQHPLGSFVVDFYCPTLRLAIELDGTVHHSAAHHAYDHQRAAVLRGMGVTVVRLRNDEVSAERLREIVTARSPSPHRGEGARG